jgi:hypothetical protein
MVNKIGLLKNIEDVLEEKVFEGIPLPKVSYSFIGSMFCILIPF